MSLATDGRGLNPSLFTASKRTSERLRFMTRGSERMRPCRAPRARVYADTPLSLFAIFIVSPRSVWSIVCLSLAFMNL